MNFISTIRICFSYLTTWCCSCTVVQLFSQPKCIFVNNITKITQRLLQVSQCCSYHVHLVISFHVNAVYISITNNGFQCLSEHFHLLYLLKQIYQLPFQFHYISLNSASYNLISRHIINVSQFFQETAIFPRKYYLI